MLKPTFTSTPTIDFEKNDGSSKASDDAQTQNVFTRTRGTGPIHVKAANRLALSADSGAMEVNTMTHNSSGHSSNANMELCSSEDRNAMSHSSGRSSSVLSNANDARNAKIKKYWLKKQHRINRKTVRYGCRQSLAKQRFRHQGRFITRKEMEQLDPDAIYDPSAR